MPEQPSYLKLVAVPAAITLAVTLLRLTGELLGWSPRFFNSEAGGGGALVGIAWLVPVFGIYFALKLFHLGSSPAGLGRLFAWSVLGLLLVPLSGFLTAPLNLGLGAQVTVFSAVSIPAAALAFRGWPALGRTLIAYGLAARIPVAFIMLLAMIGGWRTHYDAPPPGFPEMGLGARYLLTGLLPQLTFWMAYTVVGGLLFGGLALAVIRLRTRPRQAVA